MALLSRGVPFAEKWPAWRPMVDKLLYQKSISKAEWQDLFWEVHSVVSWDEGSSETVLESIMSEIINYVQDAASRVLNCNGSSAMLRQYKTEWQLFFEQSYYLPMPFKTLTASLHHSATGQFLPSTVDKNSGNLIGQKMMETWHSVIFSRIEDRIKECAMQLITDERNGESIDGQLVVAVRESLVSLGGTEPLSLYVPHFETVYLAETKAYYEHRAPTYLMDNGLLAYMEYVSRTVAAEKARGTRYLECGRNSTSMEKLNALLVKTLISQASEFMEAEFIPLLTQNDTDRLVLMFTLLDMVPNGIDNLLKLIGTFICDQALADMTAHASTIVTDCEKYIEKLLSLYVRFTVLVEEAFKKDYRFRMARDQAFRKIVNDTSIFCLELAPPTSGRRPGMPSKVVPESRCPELLANYCDILLRKTAQSKKLTSDEIEQKLKDVVLILKYVENTDVFMRFHQSHLVRRLITDTTADNEKEENMVQWLRQSGMPSEYISKLGRMFQDIKVSQDVNSSYKERLRDQGLDSVASKVNIKVLNHAAWSRSSDRVPVSLPVELEDVIPDAEEFYTASHNGRKLTWHHNLSSAVITMASNAGKYDLEVTTFQMAVLFSWNKRREDALSFQDLQLSTELGDSDLRRTMWSLVHVPRLKRQLLVVDPPIKGPREIDLTSAFRINHDFGLVRNGQVQKRGKISFVGKIHLASEKARQEDSEGIIALRVLRLQEAIVKIMKMRKTISCAKLQMELITMLSNMFVPTKRMMKEQCEWLIENQYMRRDDNNMDTFIYIA